ncbi:hypothetical protein F9278_34190 [Streptomyces phaeolivaceus]|uniref:Integral membrane protein n=1 Tax=Streptomyces phaeolivaceus TaxID=2653200 RepID=A0A5P8KAW1_9ACTN|nr:hypothetical protein [Streptomyces phaeolivaceus]QFR00386.1 hypothetical protein F9278_34190 [Streptomyces phaeolivaceus]
MSDRDHVTVGQLLLVEYQTVKDEQKTRIGFRDNLLYVTLTVLAAVIAASAQAKQPAMLLALPPVCVVLGWTYLVNDEKISAIGAYVRGDLGPRLAQLAGAEKVFDWEVAHRGDARRRSRKVIQCGIDLLAFCVVPFAGLLVYWMSGETGTELVVLSGVEAVTIVGLGVQIVLYARPARSARSARSVRPSGRSAASSG